MSDLITDDIRAWIGRADPPIEFEVTRRDIVKYAIATEQRQPRYLRGDEAPPMFLFGADRPLAALDELGPDGLRRDALLPELSLKRVMAGGIRQRYHRPIRPGDRLRISKSITDIYAKQGSSGPLIFVVYAISVTTIAGEPVLDETQTRINR
ncbi:MAG: MaoC family dehydratase N-terminal domain-containing protein [Gammaproteobacteria bacterium]